jgi:hypothetical protein
MMNRLLQVVGLPAGARVSALCNSLLWRCAVARLLLLGSVSVDGLCPTDLSGRPSRHRSVPTISGWQALPYGFSRARAYRCSREPDSRSTKPPSRCTRFWTCTVTSPRLSALLPAKCTMLTFSTRFCRRLGILNHGPRQRGFRTPLRIRAQCGVLRRPHKIQHSAPTPLLTSSGQDHWRSIR